jgi:hypothetical protein
VIGGIQDRCRDRDDGFLWTTPGLEPQVLRLEVAVLLFWPLRERTALGPASARAPPS